MLPLRLNTQYPDYSEMISTCDIKVGDLLYLDGSELKCIKELYGTSPIQSMFHEELNKIMDDDLINKVYNNLMGVTKDPLKLEITYE